MRKNKLKIKFGIFAILLMTALAISSPHYFPALFFSVTIHELGHIVMAKLGKIPLKELKLGIFGASLSLDGNTFSYGKEILLCLGGPLFNFICVIIGLQFTNLEQSLFLCSSLGLGTLNLLPIAELDGGRIFAAVLRMMLPIRICDILIKCMSFIVIFTLWCMSVYLILRVGASLALFVFSASTFVKFFISHGYQG